MEDRDATNAQIRGNLNDFNCDGKCTTRHFRSGTYEISGRLVFVGQSLHVNTYTNAQYRAKEVFGPGV
jgi:hypothetical protein